jgi:hypothetical protein
MAKASKKGTSARPRPARKRADEVTDPYGSETQGREATPDPQPIPVSEGVLDREHATDREEMPDREPTHDEVARRAYEIYVSRGQEPGRHVEDWLQARRELDAVHGRGPTA